MGQRAAIAFLALWCRALCGNATTLTLEPARGGYASCHLEWKALHQEMPREMTRVLESGERVKVSRTPGMISVLAPVFNSLGEAVAVAEVVRQEHQDLCENVK